MSTFRKQKSTLPSRTSSSAGNVKKPVLPSKSASAVTVNSISTSRSSSTTAVKTLPFVGVSVISHRHAGSVQGYNRTLLESGAGKPTVDVGGRYSERCLEIPQPNSSRSQEKLIAQAIKDISRLPSKIEQVVSEKMVDPEFQKSQFHSATRKLNVPKTGRIYRDLLDIETVPQAPVKRIAPYEQKQLDPSPVLADYLQPQYVRTKPQTPSLLQKKEPSTFLFDINDYISQNDLLRYERNYCSTLF